MKRALALVLMLAGCAAAPLQDVGIGLRNPTAPIGGTSRFDAARFAGDWHVLRCLGDCAAQVRYDLGASGKIRRQTGADQTLFTVTAPGVLRSETPEQTLVVMWVDEGFRTAAVGDAHGSWAAILDRNATSSPDRIKAATEILDFNGWDISQLRKVNK
ncbi:lipocalin [Sulfitobacter sp. M368]|uniref:lipocalin n=1 Tax=Sulfitobacter sp. M368 TaxID=2867021 RepID=UPI0021A5784D|nr:lipocalin [Sulfitobacter sp. M368]UWR14231.1 lipocalin [Sulfitobacter sp. M368]